MVSPPSAVRPAHDGWLRFVLLLLFGVGPLLLDSAVSSLWRSGATNGYTGDCFRIPVSSKSYLRRYRIVVSVSAGSGVGSP